MIPVEIGLLRAHQPDAKTTLLQQPSGLAVEDQERDQGDARDTLQNAKAGRPPAVPQGQAQIHDADDLNGDDQKRKLLSARGHHLGKRDRDLSLGCLDGDDLHPTRQDQQKNRGEDRPEQQPLSLCDSEHLAAGLVSGHQKLSIWGVGGRVLNKEPSIDGIQSRKRERKLTKRRQTLA